MEYKESLQQICSIIILSFNQMHYTKRCLESIRLYTKHPYEIIVIDNASNQETISYLEKQKDIRLVRNAENKGFAGGCNQGISIAKGKYIMLLNNDTIVTMNWLNNMVQLMESDPEISMVGPLTNSTVGKQMIPVTYEDNMDEMQQFARKLSLSKAKPWRSIRLVAFCVLIRRSLIDEIGMLDEDYQIGNYEDDDFNIRTLLAKRKAYVCRNSFIHHFMNVSFAKNNLPREKIMHKNKLILEKKWDNINWNHHAAFNTWELQKVLMHPGKSVLHIGCGLGTLAIELKDKDPEYYIVGVEDHPLRKEIAESFLDEIYEWDENLFFLDSMNGKSYDTIIIECMLEKSGFYLLEKIRRFCKQDTQIILRVFNIKHISTLERLITGEVEGNLLCASSKEFTHYYDKELKNSLRAIGYNVLEEIEVIKSLSIRQNELLVNLEKYSDYCADAKIYNRLYQIQYSK